MTLKGSTFLYIVDVNLQILHFAFKNVKSNKQGEIVLTKQNTTRLAPAPDHASFILSPDPILVCGLAGGLGPVSRQNVYACAGLNISGLFFSHFSVILSSQIKVSRVRSDIHSV